MWTGRLRPLADRLGATFFETTTAMAFADFAARGAEIAVIEVGLGGRLDSTNVVRPIASVVTKIEMDHQKYLGETLELIAREKAWIAKPGAPFVVGETRPELVAVLSDEADLAVRSLDPGAAGGCRAGPGGGAITAGTLALVGGHQRRNAAVARAVLGGAARSRMAPRAGRHRAGASRAATVPGRLDRRGKWLFDVAHNPDGVAALCRAIEELGPHPAGPRAGLHLGRQGLARDAGAARPGGGSGHSDRHAERRGTPLGPRVAAALAAGSQSASRPGRHGS